MSTTNLYIFLNKTKLFLLECKSTCIETIEGIRDTFTNLIIGDENTNTNRNEGSVIYSDQTVIEKYDEIGVDLEINNNIFTRSYRYF